MTGSQRKKVKAGDGTPKLPKALRDALAARQRMELAQLDYKRSLRLLAKDRTIPQREVAHSLAIKQPSVSVAYKQAAQVPPPRPDFCGASPFEICQRYAAGQISRDDLLDQLSRWEYAQGDVTDGYDSILVDPPGTFAEVGEALDRGLISDEDYDTVLERLAGTL